MNAATRPSGSARRRSSRDETSRPGRRAEPSSWPVRSGRKSASVAAWSPAVTTWPWRSAIATSSAGTGPSSAGGSVVSGSGISGHLRGSRADGVLDVGPVVPETEQTAGAGQRAVLGVDGDRGDPEPALPQRRHGRGDQGAPELVPVRRGQHRDDPARGTVFGHPARPWSHPAPPQDTRPGPQALRVIGGPTPPAVPPPQRGRRGSFRRVGGQPDGKAGVRKTTIPQ